MFSQIRIRRNIPINDLKIEDLKQEVESWVKLKGKTWTRYNLPTSFDDCLFHVISNKQFDQIKAMNDLADKLSIKEAFVDHLYDYAVRWYNIEEFKQLLAIQPIDLERPIYYSQNTGCRAPRPAEIGPKIGSLSQRCQFFDNKALKNFINKEIHNHKHLTEENQGSPKKVRHG